MFFFLNNDCFFNSSVQQCIDKSLPLCVVLCDRRNIGIHLATREEILSDAVLSQGSYSIKKMSDTFDTRSISDTVTIDPEQQYESSHTVNYQFSILVHRLLLSSVVKSLLPGLWRKRPWQHKEGWNGFITTVRFFLPQPPRNSMSYSDYVMATSCW
jgi:hypothetical protein